MMASVTCQKNGFDALQTTNAQLIGWKAKRRLYLYLLFILKTGDRIQTTAPDHSHACIGQIWTLVFHRNPFDAVILPCF
jgi:hypothetical protein